ncbi:SRPBCC domain-containing protein [Aestuariibacter halophilus]|uniref:SRPBCC domain-containing protein n=1 Tax=Fluctibacter halophilus TaxID=226011 RepID=A0ABS8G6T9_9ALTE|nr:SRPBCC family protein [Aestuariibacter halophilus]MCC2615806.1 SRPBCC domain-containing protein [Aestuariibacter halophilus]
MKISLLTLLMLFAQPVLLAEVVHVDEHGFQVTNTATVQQSPDQVWRALINDVDQWWPKDHTWWRGALSIEASAGGCFCEVADDRSAQHMDIRFVDPSKRLIMTGGLGPLQGMGMHGALDWTLTPIPSGTQITLSYSVVGIHPQGFTDLAPVVADVQALQLAGLSTYLSAKTTQD